MQLPIKMWPVNRYIRPTIIFWLDDFIPLHKYPLFSCIYTKIIDLLLSGSPFLQKTSTKIVQNIILHQFCRALSRERVGQSFFSVNFMLFLLSTTAVMCS